MNTTGCVCIQGQGYVSRSYLSARLSWEDERIMRALVNCLFAIVLTRVILLAFLKTESLDGLWCIKCANGRALTKLCPLIVACIYE